MKLKYVCTVSLNLTSQYEMLHISCEKILKMRIFMMNDCVPWKFIEGYIIRIDKLISGIIKFVSENVS